MKIKPIAQMRLFSGALGFTRNVQVAAVDRHRSQGNSGDHMEGGRATGAAHAGRHLDRANLNKTAATWPPFGVPLEVTDTNEEASANSVHVSNFREFGNSVKD